MSEGKLLSTGLIEKIGNTPLLELKNISSLGDVKIFAKAEFLNPSGSVKARAAKWIIEWGERTGLLSKKKTILDATSGNMGIAYAMIASVKGYRVKLTLPDNVSQERKKILKAYGAELVITDPLQGEEGAMREAQRIFKESPETYFFGDQHNNPENTKAHYFTTGVEILTQAPGITHFLAGVGTSGTLMGVGQRLKEHNPNIKVISLQPDSPFHGLEGLMNMSTSLRPKIFDPEFPDQNIFIKTEDAYKMLKRLAKEEGLFVGPSSGANVLGALELAKKIKKGIIVTILADGGDRYLSERFWEEG